MAYDEELAERLRERLDAQQDVTEKRMFGGLAFLVGGHMAVCASRRGGLMVRVDPERAETLLDQPGVENMIMRGRPMAGWLYVDRERLDGDALDGWVDEGVSFVHTLPAT